MAKNDGGPAFPESYKRITDKGPNGISVEVEQVEGMRLRDYFAAKAMQAGIARWGGAGDMYDEGCCTWSRLAMQAYGIADAMLAARD